MSYIHTKTARKTLGTSWYLQMLPFWVHPVYSDFYVYSTEFHVIRTAFKTFQALSIIHGFFSDDFWWVHGLNSFFSVVNQRKKKRVICIYMKIDPLKVKRRFASLLKLYCKEWIAFFIKQAFVPQYFFVYNVIIFELDCVCISQKKIPF